MNSPCRYCDRKGCGAYHDQCDKYKAFKAEREKVSANRAIYGLAEEDISIRIQRMKSKRSTNKVIRTHIR